MSIVFYDHLLSYEQLEKAVSRIYEEKSERDEMWVLIDELTHQCVLECVLDHLHPMYHEEFIDKFLEMPHSEKITVYLQEKVDEDVEQLIAEALHDLHMEILREMQN